nr:hypothetical protein [Tanacetum cinerariifolium]
MAHGVNCSYVETRLRDTKRRRMAALELVNLKVSYQVDVCTRESSEFCTRHHDAQKDRAAVRAKIEVLRSERLAYEQEGIQAREALARSEAYCRALEARVAVLETHARRLEWQRQAADDFAVQHIMRNFKLPTVKYADTPPRNRPLLATPRPRCEVGESFAAATRWTGPTIGHGVNYSYMETRLRDTERRMMVALELVNLRALEAGARDDTLEDTGGIDLLFFIFLLAIQIMARTRRGQTPPPTNPNNMTPEAVQNMIDQELLWHYGGRDGSHSSHTENPRNMHTARPCYYADFMKCHPLNFKGTKGAVGLTCWIEKMESIFNIKAVQNMIDQELLWHYGGRDGSHSSHTENPRNMHTARPCYYADFMKCHPLNFKGTEGIVGLTR